jgi:hypothetical protein
MASEARFYQTKWKCESLDIARRGGPWRGKIVEPKADTGALLGSGLGPSSNFPVATEIFRPPAKRASMPRAHGPTSFAGARRTMEPTNVA